MTDNTHEILTRCQSMLLRFCQTQTNTYIAASSEYLFKQAEQATGNEAQRRLFEARQAIQDQQDNLPRQLDKSLSQLFDQLRNANGNARPTAKDTTASPADLDDELSLVADDEMELKVAVSSMSHRAEADCAEALYALGQRLAVLNKGVKLEAENNPFAPSIFCQTLTELIETLDLDIRTRLILLKLFDRYFLKNLASIYGEINQFLVSQNILPNLRYKNDAKRPIAPKRRKSDTPGYNEALSASENRQTELFDVIRSILDSNQLPINPQLPVIPVDRLVADLSALQAQQLMRFQDTNVTAAPKPELPNSNTPSHQQAIECVGILFDYILNDNTLPDSVKSLLSHLHTPLLKLALLDQSFLSDPRHDGRQLMNSLISAGENWIAPDQDIKNDVFPQMQAVVKRIITEFNHDNENSSDIFATAVKDFDRYIERIERKASITEERSIQAAKGKETLEQGRVKVEQIIKDKLQDELLPKPIVQLITGPWAAFLSYTLLRHGEDSADWTNAVAIIDSLLWFIEPKIGEDDIEQAKKLHDDIIVALEHGLNSVGLEPNEIKQHLHALEMCNKLATENAQTPAEASSSASTTEPATTETQSQPETEPVESSDTADNADTQAQTSAAQQQDSLPQDSAQQVADQQSQSAAKVQADNDAVDNSSTAGQTRKRPPNVADHHLAAQDSSADPTEMVMLDDVIKPTKTGQSKRRASAKSINKVLSLEFGTWLDWKKPGEPERRLKLTWYNQNTQNCMLSNQMGQQVAVISANDIAVGMTAGWISLSDTTVKKPFFERMLETVVEQLKLKTRSA